MFSYVSLAVFVTVLGLALADQRQSPCPDNFKYLEEKPGQWVGELTTQTEYTLHGLWIRALFDGPVTSVKSENFEAVHEKSRANETLIKNRDYLLKKNTPVTVKFTVTYEGDKAPALKGIRLNARTICPAGEE